MDDDAPSSEQAWAQLLASEPTEADFLDSDAAGLVHLLNRRGESQVVDWALPLLTDPDPWRRQVAAWVLAQHGFRAGRPFGARVMPEIVRCARREADDDVRSAMVDAIGHAEDPVYVAELASYAADPFPSVRQSVASSLPLLFCGEEMDDAAIEVLIDLSTDVDPDVRDWATMSLASQSERDSPAIRTALRNRLDDPDEEDGTSTSAEAALGLARRGDDYVRPYLQRWTADDADPDPLVLEAITLLDGHA